MRYNPDIHKKQSIRIKGYDYSKEGLYFITICTHNRECLFGEISEQNQVVLNLAGKMVEEVWVSMRNDYININFTEYIVMPNHIHGIIQIVGVPLVGTQIKDKQLTGQPQGIAPTVGEIIGAFKSKTTLAYIKMVKDGRCPDFEKHIWQRNYYEKIIRDEDMYNKISEYIKNNHLKWKEDKYFT